MRTLALVVAVMGFVLPVAAEAQGWAEQAQRHVVELPDFAFHTGETLPSVTMSVYTLGTPLRAADGSITNAVMLLHGTGGSGRSLLRPSFGDELFGPGQPLDIEHHYIISPDNLGHGDSSKPSDGMRATFPRYNYDDMVHAQYRMLTEGLGVHQLVMTIGTSMGCMHNFVWGAEHPDFVQRFVSLACNAIEIAGRNRMSRQMIINGFRDDPAYADGEYSNPSDLALGQTVHAYVLMLGGVNPYRVQVEAPTRQAAEALLDGYIERRRSNPVDPNDTIYQFDASRDYNPAPRLGEITSPVLWINSGDDFLNPPGLGDPAALTTAMQKARFVLIPASEETRGHGTHSAPVFWKDHLVRFLAENQESPD